MDCFCIGRLSGTKGTVWQYTAIDVASAHVWAELHVTPRNPLDRWTSALAHRVAQDLAARGWQLKAVMSDNGSEFRSEEFERAVEHLRARHLFIHAGRPQSNGCAERVQETILQECWKPAFARYLIPQVHRAAPRPGAYLRYSTPTVLTLVATPASGLPSRSSSRRRCGSANADLSGDLGVRTA
jgi:transposase InsO family protein